jgi:hypothetical protein
MAHRIALALALLVTCSACGGAQQQARTALSVAAETVHASDQALAGAYWSAHTRALADAASITDYQDAMAPWNRAEEALRATRESLLAAEATVDAWEASASPGAFGEVAACILGGLRDVLDAFAALRLEAPPMARQALSVLGTLAGRCPHEVR